MVTRLSQVFWPVIVTPKNAIIKNVEGISKSQKLMAEMGIVRSANNGTFQIMPLGQRVFEKCIRIIDNSMQAIGGQKITLPILTSSSLWKKSGRLDGDITEFFKVRDRVDKEFLLSPTHEEAITAMLSATAPISYRDLPLRLYQIGTKFRDELKPRFGLMRAKEFLMKDMYTFDSTDDMARVSYEKVTAAYTNLLNCLEVPFARVQADAGMMGGMMSHEFHYLSGAGEDKLLICKACGYATNIELLKEETLQKCPACEKADLLESRGIEIAHTFLLGTRYSKKLGATLLNHKNKTEPLIMGCFGIGVSRIIAAAVEVLSSESELRWPTLLTPFDICIIGPKKGSREQSIGDTIEKQFREKLVELYGGNDILQDDRKGLTIGKRVMDAKKMGYPIIIVIGVKCLDAAPKLELHLRGEVFNIEPNEVLVKVHEYMKSKTELLRLTGGLASSCDNSDNSEVELVKEQSILLKSHQTTS